MPSSTRERMDTTTKEGRRMNSYLKKQRGRSERHEERETYTHMQTPIDEWPSL